MLKFIENKGNSPIYVGNTMIPPGEGAMCEVPAPACSVVAAAPAGPSLVELMAIFLDRTVKEIVLDLQGCTDEALDLALDQEGAEGGKKRKGVFDAISAEQIRRASEKLKAQEVDQAAKALEAARAELLSARVALTNLGGPDASEADRAAAAARVAEAEAKVDALKPQE